MKENIGAAIRGTRTYAISNLAESGPTTADGHAEAIEKEVSHRVEKRLEMERIVLEICAHFLICACHLCAGAIASRFPHDNFRGS